MCWHFLLLCTSRQRHVFLDPPLICSLQRFLMRCVSIWHRVFFVLLFFIHVPPVFTLRASIPFNARLNPLLSVRFHRLLNGTHVFILMPPILMRFMFPILLPIRLHAALLKNWASNISAQQKRGLLFPALFLPTSIFWNVKHGLAN